MEDYEGADVVAPAVPGYDVGRCLGRGGSAIVWLVREQSTGREYALKAFRADDDSGREDTEAAVRREVRILSALEHEHLVRARAVLRLRAGVRRGSAVPDGDGAGEGGDGSPGAGLGLIMDYAAGGSLAELMAGRGKLGPGETVTVLTPIAQALAYLHSQGFTHGDVSPGNVLFTAHGKPLLADLGVARMVADARAVTEAGTEGFRDPAPVDAVRAGVQPERDVYSLAALGWFCLTGRAPEPGAQRPPLPLLVPDVPAALTAALEAGLHEDRRLRPAAAELAAAVQRSAPAAPVDLSVSVHPTVIPQLLTRRALPLTARARRAERLRSLQRRFSKPRSARPLPPAGSPKFGHLAGFPAGRPIGLPSGGIGARHSGRRTSSDPGPARPETAARPRPGTRLKGGDGRGYRAASGTRAAAVGLALSGVLVTAWAFAGSPLAASFPTFAVGSSETGRESEQAAVAPAVAAPAVPPEVQIQLASPDPEEAVRGLARLRSLAFSSGDFGLLEQVNVPASPAAEADGRISAGLRESGRVLSGFSTVLSQVAATRDSGSQLAEVAVSVVTSAYQERDAAGVVLADAAAVPEQRLRLVLSPVEGRWRIQQILPADDGAGDRAVSQDPGTTGG